MDEQQFYIFKRGSFYYVQFLDSTGKPRQLSTGSRTRSGAIRFAVEKSREMPTASSSKLFSTFKADFESYSVSVYAESTRLSYLLALKNLIAFAGDVPLDSIGVETLERFKVHRLKSVTPVTVNIELRSIKALFGLMKRWKLITVQPFDDIKLLRVQKRDPEYLSKEEYRKLIASITEPWLRHVVQFAVFTGMRISEILNLRWSNIDFDRRMIQCANSKEFTTKSKKDRNIPISNQIVALLGSLDVPDATGYVFLKDGKKLFKNLVSKRFKFYVRDIGLSPTFHFHNLRTTFASWLLMEGVDVYIVSRLLGHSDVSVTAKHYANVRDEYMLRTLNQQSLKVMTEFSAN